MMKIIWSLCLIFSLFNSILSFSSPANHLCLPDQRDALWEFKSEFYIQKPDWMESDTKTTTEKWKNTDCCSWDGVSCDPKTGKVVELFLWASSLNGPLRSNSSLFRLKHLQRLELTSNNLSGTLPSSISNLKHLKVLNLRGCDMFGKIPSSLGNLSHLTNLDLSENDFTGELPDSIGSLTQLTELQLAVAKLTGKFPLQLLNLSELNGIDLRFNHFQGMLPSNMSSLSKLASFDITGNSFSGSVPSSLFLIPSLMILALGKNDFNGPLEIGYNISSSPSTLGSLSLEENSFIGPISGSISKLVGLWYLVLSFWNTEKGMVDFSSFLHLKSLKTLHLSYLNTRSIVDLSLFSHLMSLSDLDLSGITVKISETLSLPSTIETLALSSCNIAVFPKFLQNLTSLYSLDISVNRIEGQVPEWLWSLPALRYVNISQNVFSGFEGSADVIQRSEKVMLDISSNTFQDPFPLLSNSTVYFSGSNNRFSGEIPRALCELVNLDTLVLSNNNFSGSFPRCFNARISVLHIQNNSLSGVFPEESVSVYLRSLDVGRNRLSGKLPKSLINCTILEFLNMGDNNFNDTFPFWLSSLANLQILVLRSNKFHGPLSSLMFDISENHFTGVLPSDYFASWSAMSSAVDIVDSTLFKYAGRSSPYYHNSVGLTNKGLKMELVGSVFTMYKTIDVSGNRLEGDVPESICLLKELIVLNMSNNAFTGRIPSSLGKLSNLQSLDLSQNGLSGGIPPELGKLTFLARMNFSHNRLVGPIPQGTQIQSQNSSSFAENHGLCGVPLQETCGGKEEEEEATKEEEEEDQTLSWIAVVIAYVPSVFCGLTISHILFSCKPDWFMRIFHSFT
ncbi:unnamed protein product [Microthlaspi erraticum]|uniref:Uncharacterized protein n=1 Tax=Microthlaspi erraticum TaxID=1685480 RepID=A0A6D2ISE1_9BRAS|nr:unnamed protein product [Microthlaspi erraticum]